MTLTLKSMTVAVIVGCVFRIAIVIPGLLSNNVEARFSRPDTAYYLDLCDSFLNDEPSSLTKRTPGFSFFIAIIKKIGGNTTSIILSLTVCSMMTLIINTLMINKFCDKNIVSISAVWLLALNCTAIANTSLLLSDTLFGLFVTIQLWCFINCHKTSNNWFFLLGMGVAALGALIRPINILWVVVGPIIYIFIVETKIYKRLLFVFAGIILFMIIILPWQLRNKHLGAGLVIDTNTGAMWRQNGAALLAEVNGTSLESEKANIISEENTIFIDLNSFPDEKSREEYRVKRYMQLIAKYPLTWLKQQFFNWHILLPDVPTICENLGITTHGKGTLGVLQRDGVIAATKHYFANNAQAVVICLPLIFATLGLYCLMAIQLFRVLLTKNRWICLLFFGGFILYYLWLPGAITVPRYQIPALPGITLIASGFFSTSKKHDKTE